jgi:hypothetical protein
LGEQKEAAMALERLEHHPEFHVAAGSTDIRGWPLFDRDGLQAGRIEGLLFDPAAGVVPYTIVDLWDKHVLLRTSDIEIDDESRRTRTPIYARTDLHGLAPYEGIEPAHRPINQPVPDDVFQACSPSVSELGRTSPPEEQTLLSALEFEFGAVDIERRSVNRPARADEGVRIEGELIIIPIMGEEIVVERRPIVKEEIVLRKRSQTLSHGEQRGPQHVRHVTFASGMPDIESPHDTSTPGVPAVEPPHGPGRPDDPRA